MEKIKLGLIGCGGMMNYHVNGLLTFDDVEIIAVADPRPERTAAMCERTGAARFYSSHEAFFEKEKNLDAVYIAVEPTAHKGIEETAIQMNLPFLIEKPMTLDMVQAKKINDAVQSSGLITAVGFQDRYLDIIDRTKDELKDMKVGMVYASWLGGVPQVWWWMKKATCGGQLIEQTIHLVDLLRYLFGEADSVYATRGRGLISPNEFPDDLPGYDNDDFSTVMITFKNGLTATLMSGCFVSGKGDPIRSGITIIGRDKSIEYRLRESVTVYTADTKQKYNFIADQSVAHDRAFLDAIKTKDTSGIRSPYSDAYKSLVLADAADRSMETGEVVKL